VWTAVLAAVLVDAAFLAGVVHLRTASNGALNEDRQSQLLPGESEELRELQRDLSATLKLTGSTGAMSCAAAIAAIDIARTRAGRQPSIDGWRVGAYSRPRDERAVGTF
jgi:hypothetical protein